MAMISVGMYWFLIHPKSYKAELAIKNGDVVLWAGGLANTDKLHAFIRHVEDQLPDKIRIATYSKEGYPTIFDLEYDGNKIICVTDNTRNLFGREKSKSYGEYTNISKNDNDDYFLIDERGSYQEQWIFQE